MVGHSALIHDFPYQAHSLGATSGFATATQPFASPMVSTHDSLGEVFSPMLSHARQVRPTHRPQTVFSSPSPAPTFAAPGYSSFGGGQQFPSGHQRAPTASFPSQATSSSMSHPGTHTQRSVVPSPTLSLQMRLREMPPGVLEAREAKIHMKTVDSVTEHFDLVFSGDSGQDWMNHVNELERQQASMDSSSILLRTF